MKKLFAITVLLSIIIILIPACSKEKMFPEMNPQASFSSSSDKAFINDRVYFKNESLNAPTYLWQFGDGESSTAIFPDHVYKKTGTYTIKLTAYSADGKKSDEATKDIKIVDHNDLVASFTYSPATIYVNDVVHFTNTSANAGSYSWNFGDGGTSTTVSPTHKYSNAGNYTVTLTAYSPDGTRSDTHTKNIQVQKHSGGSNLTITVNGVSFKMIYVEGGTFSMGATSEQGSDPEDDEYPVHQVTLSSYYIGEFEVTQELWKAVRGSNPSHFTGNLQKPVEQVSWNDIVNNFLPALNAATGRTFALPTEAQWEFAARGGTKSQHYKYSGSNTLGNVAWYYDNSGSQTHLVGQKQANELGIYDMSGNVYEWCKDWYGSNYYQNSPSTNPQGPSSGSTRVLRGGSWFSYAYSCRVSSRHDSSPDGSINYIGFRLVFFP